MKRFLSIAAAVVVAALGGVMILGASPQDEPKAKSAAERIETLEKRVVDLEKKVVELQKSNAELQKKIAALDRKGSGRLEDSLDRLFDRFGGGEGWDDLKKKLDEFRDNMPELPDFESMPDPFQGMDMDQLLEMLKGQLEGQLPGFFDGLDLEGLFDQFKGDMPKPEPKKKQEPKRRTI